MEGRTFSVWTAVIVAAATVDRTSRAIATADHFHQEAPPSRREVMMLLLSAHLYGSMVGFVLLAEVVL